VGFFSETGRLLIDKNHDSIKQRKEFEKFWDFFKKIFLFHTSSSLKKFQYNQNGLFFFIMQAAILVDPDSSIE